jgi:hypothetical protein
MIFLDYSLEEWLRRYPDLKVTVGTCDNCGNPMPTVRPFIAKDYAGLQANDCACAQNRHTAMSLVTTNERKHREWAIALSGT